MYDRISEFISGYFSKPYLFLSLTLLLIIWLLSEIFFEDLNYFREILRIALAFMSLLLLMILQKSQNKDMKALNVKLDELIRTQQNANERLINAEDETEEELENL